MRLPGRRSVYRSVSVRVCTSLTFVLSGKRVKAALTVKPSLVKVPTKVLFFNGYIQVPAKVSEPGARRTCASILALFKFLRETTWKTIPGGYSTPPTSGTCNCTAILGGKNARARVARDINSACRWLQHEQLKILLSGRDNYKSLQEFGRCT